MNITKEQLRKVLSDGFDENMTDVDNWNEAVFYNNKDKFIEDVVNNLSQHLVSKCDCSLLVACEICGNEKGLDGDFWKNKDVC
tara:strand:+ start:116 stop:364 length:249 start_codon:yes stop_codon:yes gene_type:complete